MGYTMELLKRFEEALKEAIRAKHEAKRDAVRLLLTAVKVKEKELRRPLSEAEIQQVITSQIKQRRDSAEQYLRGGREELAHKENEEIVVLQVFLPDQLSSEDLGHLIDEALSESGAQSSKDMGKVMKILMDKVAGRADGKVVNELVRQKLSA
jgi:uncharacterized protein